MKKKIKQRGESEIEIYPESSDNIIKNVKYLKKRELQRAILHKLISSDIKRTVTNKDSEQEIPDSI